MAMGQRKQETVNRSAQRIEIKDKPTKEMKKKMVGFLLFDLSENPPSFSQP